MPDRHKDGSHVVATRLSAEEWDRLQLVIARSPLAHDTPGGYLRWLFQQQVLRRR